MNDDLALLKRFAASRDETDFSAIVSNHLPMVFGVCFRRTGNKELAEELTQNVFASLAKKASRIGDQVNLSGWLHRAASFECSHALRTESNRNRLMKRFAEMLPEPDSKAGNPPPRDVSRQLDSAINQLPKQEQDMVLMRFSEDLTLRQIGAKLGKSESATQRHLTKVLEKLALLLRKRGVTTSTVALAAILTADFSKAAPIGITAASVSKAALASAAISKTTILTTIAMTNKTTTIAAGLMILTVAGGIAYVKTSDSETPAETTQMAASPNSSSQPRANSATEKATTLPEGNRSERTTDADARLVDQYGESRVKLSRHIAKRTIHLYEQINSLSAMAADIQEAFGNAAGRGEDQQAQELNGDAGADQPDPTQREIRMQEMEEDANKAIAQMKETQKALEADSIPLQETLLAADAVTRGEMSQEDYDLIAARSPQPLPPMPSAGMMSAATDDGSPQKPQTLQQAEEQVEKQIKAIGAVQALIETMQ